MSHPLAGSILVSNLIYSFCVWSYTFHRKHMTQIFTPLVRAMRRPHFHKPIAKDYRMQQMENDRPSLSNLGHLQMKLRGVLCPPKGHSRWETHDPDGSSVSLAPRQFPLSPLHWIGLSFTISVTLYLSQVSHSFKKSKEY